jgi:hypothetical protein
MEVPRIFLLIGSPLLGIISFFLLRYYNNGYGQGLYSKRWYFRFGILSIVLSITSFILYFINPDILFVKDTQVINKLGELEWFEIIVAGIVAALIAKAIDYIIPKSRRID